MCKEGNASGDAAVALPDGPCPELIDKTCPDEKPKQSTPSETMSSGTHGVHMLQWYGENFAAADSERRQRFEEQIGLHGNGFVSTPTYPKTSVEQSHTNGDQPLLAVMENGAKLKHIHPTFGYSAGTAKHPCFAKFDIRDEVCRPMGGFRHGQVVMDSEASGCELVVVGVKADPKSGERRLWVQPLEAGSRRGAIPCTSEQLRRLTRVLKGGSYSIPKRASLEEVVPEDFEAVEDSDGEEVLLCKQCRLPVGTKLYADEEGNPLHGECMAQAMMQEASSQESSTQDEETALKSKCRKEHAIGWHTNKIPRNKAVAAELGLEGVSQGMCCLQMQPGMKGRTLRVVPAVDPAACVNLEYLSLALKVRTSEGREPMFSLDPVAEHNNSPDNHKDRKQVKNFSPAWLSGTSAGEVLFQADYHLKELSMGEFEQPIVGMKSCLDFFCQEAGEKEWRAREWFVVRKAEMRISEDHVLVPFLKMGIEAREQVLSASGLEDKALTSLDHPLVRYAQDFTENFDLIAERKSVVYQLRELAKASILAKFLLESEIEFDDAWLEFAGSLLDTDSESTLEIPQLWNQRSKAQICVKDGKIIDSNAMPSKRLHGVYGGVQFGLQKFRLTGALTARAGASAAALPAPRAATVNMTDLRSVGMLIASMQGVPPAAPEAVAARPGAPAVTPTAPTPGAPRAPIAIAGIAEPTKKFMQQKIAGMRTHGGMTSAEGLIRGVPLGRIPMPNLQGVDLNLDNFDLEEPVQMTGNHASGNLEMKGGAAQAFWESLDSDESDIFRPEDKAFLRDVFNPKLSDRRDEGEQFVPPNPNFEYIERLRSLVQKEEMVRRRRKERFFSSQFSPCQPGHLFPQSWAPTLELTNQVRKPDQAPQLQPRPDYLAEAHMFDAMLASTTPAFDKVTEEGVRFRIYKFGSLDVRTLQERDGKEVIGAVFARRYSESAKCRIAQGCEHITRATEYVEGIQTVGCKPLRQSYVVLETSEGNTVVTEKFSDGSVSWQHNPEDIEDRNSLAKFIRSWECSGVKKAKVTIKDLELYKDKQTSNKPTSESERKHFAQGAFNEARGTGGRVDSGFGSKNSWNKTAQAKLAQREVRRAKMMAGRAAAERAAKAQKSLPKKDLKVTDPAIVGTWSEWAEIAPMAFDEERKCYSVELEMGSAGWESFQIMCDGKWERCLHPDREHCHASQEHKVCGPDSDGYDLNWTIGLHEQDQAVAGATYRIYLKVNAAGVAKKVEWERLAH